MTYPHWYYFMVVAVVSESYELPSGGGVEHWLVDKSQVPESHMFVTTGHPWQVPDSQMPFVVCALPSSHLACSYKCQGYSRIVFTTELKRFAALM